jgi:hypothetical protein
VLLGLTVDVPPPPMVVAVGVSVTVGVAVGVGVGASQGAVPVPVALRLVIVAYVPGRTCTSICTFVVTPESPVLVQVPEPGCPDARWSTFPG